MGSSQSCNLQNTIRNVDDVRKRIIMEFRLILELSFYMSNQNLETGFITDVGKETMTVLNTSFRYAFCRAKFLRSWLPLKQMLIEL